MVIIFSGMMAVMFACDTSPTNSSSIVNSPSSPLSRANDEGSQSADNTTSTSSTPLDQRMSLREGLKR